MHRLLPTTLPTLLARPLLPSYAIETEEVRSYVPSSFCGQPGLYVEAVRERHHFHGISPSSECTNWAYALFPIVPPIPSIHAAAHRCLSSAFPPPTGPLQHARLFELSVAVRSLQFPRGIHPPTLLIPVLPRRHGILTQRIFHLLLSHLH